MKQMPKIKRGEKMRKTLATFSILGTILLLSIIATFGSVAASPPDDIKSEMFICPSVSPNNPRGMWIIGGSGAYYVNFPGTASSNWPMKLNPFKAVEDNPADVEGQAQTPAGKGLYHKLPPIFEGMAMVLEDAVGQWGITESGPQSIEISQGIPIASAVFW